MSNTYTNAEGFPYIFIAVAKYLSFSMICIVAKRVLTIINSGKNSEFF